METELTAYAIGDAPDYLVEEGLVKAQYYFDMNGLEPQECLKAYERSLDSILGKHWDVATDKANLILLGNRMYDNSIIFLEIELFS